jgi:hypothetical protein
MVNKALMADREVGVLRGFVSAYSQKLVKGTKQRFYGHASVFREAFHCRMP